MSFVTLSCSVSHLVSLTELKTEVHQVLHPDEAVSILVTDVKNLLEPPQKLKQLFLFGKDASFHYTGFAHDIYLISLILQRTVPTAAIDVPRPRSAGPTAAAAAVTQAAPRAREARGRSERGDDLRFQHEALRHRPAANITQV